MNKQAPSRVALCGLAAVLLGATSCGGGGSAKTGSAGPATTASRSTKGADPGSQSAGDPASTAYTPTGTLIADSGFRPDANGFKFENYGAEQPTGTAVTNFTPDDVRKLYGDGVCADAQAGKCDLTPQAQAWMTEAMRALRPEQCPALQCHEL